MHDGDRRRQAGDIGNQNSEKVGLGVGVLVAWSCIRVTLESTSNVGGKVIAKGQGDEDSGNDNVTQTEHRETGVQILDVARSKNLWGK